MAFNRVFAAVPDLSSPSERDNNEEEKAFGNFSADFCQFVPGEYFKVLVKNNEI